jgi:hypothetical protein
VYIVDAQYIYIHTNVLHKRYKLANLLLYVCGNFGCQYPKALNKCLHCREVIRSETQAFSTLNVLANPFVRAPYTDKKENQIGAVAKSYMTNGLLIYMGKYVFAHSLIYYRKPFLICDFATAPL